MAAGSSPCQSALGSSTWPSAEISGRRCRSKPGPSRERAVQRLVFPAIVRLGTRADIDVRRARAQRADGGRRARYVPERIEPEPAQRVLVPDLRDLDVA